MALAGMQRIEEAKIAAFFSRVRNVLAVNVAISLLTASFLWNSVSRGMLIAWVSSILAITAFRLCLLREYDRFPNVPVFWWQRIAITGSALSGLAWGLLPTALFPHGAALQQILLLLVVMGMIAGSAVSWYAYFPAFQAYFVPLALLCLSRLVFEISSGKLAPGVITTVVSMYLIYSASLYSMARKSSRMLTRMLASDAEKAASDLRYRKLFHGARIPMLLTDPETGRIVDVNAAACSYYGYTREALREMDMGQIHLLLPDSFRKTLSQAEGEGCLLLNNRLASGETRDVEVHAGTLFLGERKLQYLIIHDITERRRAEQELEREITKTRLLFRTAGDGLHILDEKGCLLEASDSFYRMLGYAPQEMVGMNLREWDKRFDAETDIAQLVSQIPDNGKIVDTCHIRKDGTLIDVEIHAVNVTIDGRRFIYASSRDISERKLMERKLRERNAHFTSILDNMPHMVWLKDTEGRYLAINRQLARTIGTESPSGFIGKTDHEVWPLELAEKYRKDDLEVMNTRRRKYLEEEGLDKGRKYWSETFKTPIVDDDGNVLGTAGYASDITGRKLIEESMKLSSLVFQTSGEAIVVTDEQNRIIDVNPAFTRITGYEPEEVVGTGSNLLRSETADHETLSFLLPSIEKEGHWQGELWSLRKGGEVFAHWTSISIVHTPEGKVHRHVLQFSDITEKKKKDEIIWLQANFDTLTNLPNRRMFRNRLRDAIRQSERSGLPFALAFIDLDHFTEINDTWGHDAGDLLIMEISERIGKPLRSSDTIARMGGDEFTVIIPELNDLARLGRIVKNMLVEVSMPCLLGQELVQVTASIGLTFYPLDATDADTLLKNADLAMYAAKAKGGNAFEYFTAAMKRKAEERVAFSRDLRMAQEKGEFRIHYQPIMHIASGHLFRAEALLRWNHPSLGMIEPARFVPLSEELGIMPEIGEWIFHEVASTLKRWQGQYGRIVPLCINTPRKLFSADEIGRQWSGWIERLGLPPGSLTLEIREDTLSRNPEKAKQLLDSLRRGGMEITIEDFGVGSASLEHLRNFEVDFLKIDRAFVSSVASEERDAAIVEAVISMAHHIGLRVVAEGVENLSQLEILKSIGCDFAQGFLYSPPLAPAEFEKFFCREAALPVRN